MVIDLMDSTSSPPVKGSRSGARWSSVDGQAPRGSPEGKPPEETTTVGLPHIPVTGKKRSLSNDTGRAPTEPGHVRRLVAATLRAEGESEAYHKRLFW